MNKLSNLLIEAVESGFDTRNMFSFYTSDQFISFSNWVNGRHSFDWQKYEQWLHANYNLWHDPMPPIYAPGNLITFSATFGEDARPVPARVNAVHIYTGESKYDVELQLSAGIKERIHNVSSGLLHSSIQNL